QGAAVAHPARAGRRQLPGRPRVPCPFPAMDERAVAGEGRRHGAHARAVTPRGRKGKVARPEQGAPLGLHGPAAAAKVGANRGTVSPPVLAAIHFTPLFLSLPGSTPWRSPPPAWPRSTTS